MPYLIAIVGCPHVKNRNQACPILLPLLAVPMLAATASFKDLVTVARENSLHLSNSRCFGRGPATAYLGPGDSRTGNSANVTAEIGV